MYVVLRKCMYPYENKKVCIFLSLCFRGMQRRKNIFNISAHVILYRFLVLYSVMNINRTVEFTSKITMESKTAAFCSLTTKYILSSIFQNLNM